METPTPNFLYSWADPWDKTLRFCIHSLAFSFLYHSTSQVREQAKSSPQQPVPHADGLTLSHVLPHLDEAE